MKPWCFMAALVLSAALLSAQDASASVDAASIVDASRNRIQADTVSTRSRMVITAKDGSTTERLLDQYSKDDPQGNNRIIIVFQRPPSVAGTRFLTIAKTGGADDRWIFLPSLGKVRRVAGSEGSGSFVGTDLSYDDVSSTSRDVNQDNHRLLREEALNGSACYVIESIPKDSGYQYSKMVQWINKSTSVTHQIELYDKKGTLVKRLEIQSLKDIQGRLTPMLTKMTTLTTGTSTTISVDIMKYDDPIPEAVFTTQYLETGRAR
ncbi:MAG: outer membrane lipoprotein-sorting protein [Treponema sp.]|jgi:outer membrane lipoprotein-sorting protein|nr:outer membrane lipoprotein-sorting protein [Treponema sp.]